MADMEIVRQFNSELSTLYATKPPISKAKVTSITRLALKAVKYYKHVVQSLEKFVQKCRPEYKIPALYVIDSIIRQSRHQFGAEKDVFGPRFGKNIMNSFENFYKCLPEEKSKLIKVLNLWQKNKVYPPDVIQPLLNLAQAKPTTQQLDTTQHASGEVAAGEIPQEQMYIAMLQKQQEEQVRRIREMEERLQQQQQTKLGNQPESLESEPKFQLPTEVFQQIQALTGMVNQQGSDPPGHYQTQQYTGEGDRQLNKEKYQHDVQLPAQQNQGHHQGYNYPDANQGNTFYSNSQQQSYVDDFDYGDDQDDQQRIAEKKRQLEKEASRLNNLSSFEQVEVVNARQRMEEQFRQQQKVVSSIPPQKVPEISPAMKVPETLQPLNDTAIPAFQPTFQPTFTPHAQSPPRNRSRSPRERRHREVASERERGRDRPPDDRNRLRDRPRDDQDRSREDRDRAREDRDRKRNERERSREIRDKQRPERDERDGHREERDRAREERERTREDRDRPREERERSRNERERPREERRRSREEREPRAREKEREKEEEKAVETKEVKEEKWIPPVKEDHVSVCSRTVWLGKMNRSTTKESLQEMFKEYGEVQLIDMIIPRGCAYIQMAEREAAYHSLSSRQILRNNYKLAWAPAKGAKEYKDHFNKELGVTYIPIAKLEKSSDTITTLSEGGWIDPRTITESLKKKEEEESATVTSSDGTTGQTTTVVGMPFPPPGFPAMPPGQVIPPGMPRFPPFGIPPPGMVPPPGMNFPGMQFQPGNMPFPRPPFMPGMNPYMMPPRFMPGMQQQTPPMPGMPPMFSGQQPVAGGAQTNVDSGQTVESSQDEAVGQGKTVDDTESTENIVPPGQEDVPQYQGAHEPNLQSEQQMSYGQTAENTTNTGVEQFNTSSEAPPFENERPSGDGGPRPPFQSPFGPPFAPQGNSRFQGPPPNGPQGQLWRPQGDSRNQWRPENQQWRPEGGRPNENWRNEREHWGHENDKWGPENEPWRHDGGRDRWGHNDRRGRRGRDWEEPFERQKRGRFDNDWGPPPHDRHHWGPPFDRHQGPPHDRHQGPSHDRHQGPSHDRHPGPPYDRHQGPSHDRHQGHLHDRHQAPPHDRHKGPPYDRHQGPPYDRHQGPPHDRHQGPPHDRHQGPRLGAPGFGSSWKHDEQRSRWGEQDEASKGNPIDQYQQGGEQQENNIHHGGADPNNDETAKGWAEIKALKEKITNNKINESTETSTLAPGEGEVGEEKPNLSELQVAGGSNETPPVGVSIKQEAPTDINTKQDSFTNNPFNSAGSDDDVQSMAVEGGMQTVSEHNQPPNSSNVEKMIIEEQTVHEQNESTRDMTAIVDLQQQTMKPTNEKQHSSDERADNGDSNNMISGEENVGSECFEGNTQTSTDVPVQLSSSETDNDNLNVMITDKENVGPEAFEVDTETSTHTPIQLSASETDNGDANKLIIGKENVGSEAFSGGRETSTDVPVCQSSSETDHENKNDNIVPEELVGAKILPENDGRSLGDNLDNAKQCDIQKPLRDDIGDAGAEQLPTEVTNKIDSDNQETIHVESSDSHLMAISEETSHSMSSEIKLQSNDIKTESTGILPDINAIQSPPVSTINVTASDANGGSFQCNEEMIESAAPVQLAAPVEVESKIEPLREDETVNTFDCDVNSEQPEEIVLCATVNNNMNEKTVSEQKEGSLNGNVVSSVQSTKDASGTVLPLDFPPQTGEMQSEFELTDAKDESEALSST